MYTFYNYAVLNTFTLITLARNGLLGPFLWPLPSSGSGLAIGKEITSNEPLGSELWPFKEGNHQICLKIVAFVTLFVNPFSNSHNSGPEFSKI